MAVLYRSHFHALELQLELTRRNIPFSITSGIRFFEQAHIKDVTAFIRFVANPRDEVAFKRMVKLLPGIGNRSAENLWNAWEKFVGGDGEPGPKTRKHQPRSAIQLQRLQVWRAHSGDECARDRRNRGPNLPIPSMKLPRADNQIRRRK